MPLIDNQKAAADLAAAATVVAVGDDWGPIRIYRIELPDQNATVDVAANSEDDARQQALPAIVDLVTAAAATSYY